MRLSTYWSDLTAIRFKKILIPITALAAAILACRGPFVASTPAARAMPNALYTAVRRPCRECPSGGCNPTDGFATLAFRKRESDGLCQLYARPPLSPVPVSRCDAAAFVSDVTYPDGSDVTLGSTFTKIWRLKNVGTCTWTLYALVL
jgi:hypothetical protein